MNMQEPSAAAILARSHLNPAESSASDPQALRTPWRGSKPWRHRPHAADPASRQGVAAELQIHGQTNMRQTGCHATPESDASPFQGVRVPKSAPLVKVAR